MFVDPATIKVKDLPSLDFAERAQFPAIAGIYFVIGRDDVVYYIGRTKNLSARWPTHHLRHNVDHNNMKIAWLVVDTPDLLPHLELACIHYFRPVWNKVGVASDPIITKQIRISTDLYDRIMRLAFQERRPMTSQIAILIEPALREAEARHVAQTNSTKGANNGATE